MPLTELRRAFGLANSLCQQLDEVDECRIVQDISKILRLLQGPPVSVGSGCASMCNKMHGLVHGERLQADSWRSAVDMANQTLTWTGDLGTESNIVRFRKKLVNVFPWVSGGLHNEPQFDF